MPQIQSLTGKSPLERLEQSLSMANDQYSQGRQQEFTIGQELQKRAKQRKEENFVQGNIGNLLESVMTPDQEGNLPDESTVKTKAFNTGLALVMGGGETGQKALPILDKLVTTMLPVRKQQYGEELAFDEKGNPKMTEINGVKVPLFMKTDVTSGQPVLIDGKPSYTLGKNYQKASEKETPKAARAGRSWEESRKAFEKLEREADGIGAELAKTGVNLNEVLKPGYSIPQKRNRTSGKMEPDPKISKYISTIEQKQTAAKQLNREFQDVTEYKDWQNKRKKAEASEPKTTGAIDSEQDPLGIIK